MKKNNVLKFKSNIKVPQVRNEKEDLLEIEKRKIVEMAIKAILNALDQKDHYTFGHSMRVAYFSLVMGREIGLNSDQIYELEMSALFHDIGKIGIPDLILNKPTRLEEEEFNIMKKHPEKSAEILIGFEGMENVAKSARHHHERYDGRGYPDRLKAEEIPLGARIILIADTFDAMTSTRPYRKGLDYELAFEELKQFSGSQFDPQLVEAFILGMTKEMASADNTFFLSIMNRRFEKKAA